MYGSKVTLHHKGKTGFGTILGGTLSFALTVFIGLFLFCQAFGWATDPQYKQNFFNTYLHRNETTYTIPIQSFLPTISFLSIGKNFDGETIDEYMFNDKNFFEINMYRIVNGLRENVDVTYCKDLISSWDIPKAETDQFNAEVANPLQLCPNMTEFQVRDRVLAIYEFVIEITLTELGEQFDGRHFAFTTDITRHFNPQDYKNDGF